MASFDPSGSAGEGETSWSPVVIGAFRSCRWRVERFEVRPALAGDLVDQRSTRPLVQAGRVGAGCPSGRVLVAGEAAADVVVEVGRQVPRRGPSGWRQVDDEQVGRGVRPDRLGEGPAEGEIFLPSGLGEGAEIDPGIAAMGSTDPAVDPDGVEPRPVEPVRGLGVAGRDEEEPLAVGRPGRVGLLERAGGEAPGRGAVVGRAVAATVQRWAGCLGSR